MLKRPTLFALLEKFFAHVFWYQKAYVLLHFLKIWSFNLWIPSTADSKFLFKVESELAIIKEKHYDWLV